MPRSLAPLALGLLIASTARAEGQLHLATCPQQGAEYRATLRYHVVVARPFLDETVALDGQLRDAVKQQLRYIWGWYRTHDDIPDAPELVLGAEEPEIELGARTEIPYGADLVLDWHETSPDLQITDPYTLRAIRRGLVHRGDPALRVDYVAHFQVALCGSPRPTHSTLPAAVPADPWLMHWRVPASARRPLSYFGEKAVTNPCVDDDYADLPHPYYHWYDWLPERHGPDDEGKPFDCRRLLHSGVDYFPVTVDLDRTASPSGTLDGLRARLAGGAACVQPVRATFLFGILDPTYAGMNYPKLQAALGEGDGAQLAVRTEQLLANGGRALERGSRKLVQMLAGLPQVMKVDHAEATLAGEYLRVRVAGHLLQSGRAIELQSYVGFTNVFGPTPHHWDILRQALTSADVIVYAGHSGIGENFRLAQIEKNLQLDPTSFAAVLRQSPFQLIAFLSCYSYMYFGRDLEKATAQGGAGRELLYSGTPFTKQEQGALAVLGLIDSVYASAPGTKQALRFVEPADFLLVKGAPSGP